MSNSTSLTGSSKQYIGVVDMLCEGPIYGLENGKNDVYINDVPFENATLVGSLTDSGSARFLTLSPVAGSATNMTVTNGTIKETDAGKYAHIEARKVTVSAISQSNQSGYTTTTITPSETLSTEWNNYSLDKYYTKLRNTVTGRVYNTYSYWAAGTNVLTLLSLPVRRGFGTASNWEVVLVQSSKIASYTSDTAFTLGDNLHNAANVTNARFTISASVATNPDNPNPDATTSKVEGSTLQFRQGKLEQSPISQVHGVSGGVTKTGSTTVADLKQYNNQSELNNYISGSAYSGISTFGYPTGQSYSQNAGAQLVYASSAFGASTPEQVNEVNVRINYNSLIVYNTENGDKEDAYAVYVFEVKTELNGEETPYRKLFGQYGTFVVHRGRTTAPVSFDHTIGLDRFKPFDDFTIRITRLTRDAGLPVRANGSNGGETDVDKWNLQAAASTGGANLSSTIHDSFIYPHTAVAAVSFSSKSYTQLPQRSYLLKGLMVEIPTAYTPREYSSTGVAEYDEWWDGNFKTELHYTDNPAWVFYDIATNARYGAGNWLESYNLDKFALYRIAKYCDELVDDGNGGTEPRFRANVYLAKATDVYKVLKDFATIFTGMLYWLDGKLSPIQDVPSEPVYTFSKANVRDGKFNYESTGRKTRSNQVVVTWNDPTRNYEPVNLIVEDREDIVAQRKIVSQKAIAFGATSEGQAIRYGRWKLWTAQNQKEIVSFETGLQGAFIRPGDVINIQDRDRYGIDFSGKIKAVNTSTKYITLDRELTNITDPDGGAITYEMSTLVTNFAAYYTGLDPIHINNSTGRKVSSNPGDDTVTTFNRGDRYTAVFWYPDPSSGAPAGEVNGFHAYYSTSNPPGFETNEIETGANDIYDLSADNAKNVISQAHYLVAETGGDLGSNGDPSGSGYSTYPLQLEWKPHSYVVTKDVTLTNSGGTTTVSMVNSNDWYVNQEIPTVGTIFALVAKNSGNVNFLGSAKEYRVLGISFEDSKNIYGISAVEHYNSKYDAVDKDYALGVIPDNTYAEIEDPDAVVPAPGNIYVVSETDSSKPGEEFRIEWDVPQEQYTDAGGTTREREYEFLNDYEIYHTIPDLDNPLFTANNSYRFQGVPDGVYTFRVRTRSRKGNTSDYVSVTYDVNDPFGTNVPRVVGGLPKGIVANSTAYDVHNAEITDEEDRYKLIWERDTSAKGYSIGNSMFGGNNAIATYLDPVGLFGLAVSGPLVYVANNIGTSVSEPDGYAGDSEWHYLHYNGSDTRLAYWNTITLDNLPFYHKIDNNGFGWRGSYQPWTYLSGVGGFTQASVAAGSNRLVATNYGDFTNDLKIRDIVHFDGKAQTFEMYKVEQLENYNSEGIVSVRLREWESAGVATSPGWVNGDIVTFERVSGATNVNGQYYYVKDTAESERYQLYHSINLGADAIISGNTYVITSTGTTSFTSIGASSNAVGTVFTATDTGTGTGTVDRALVTSELGGAYTTLTGFVTRAKVKAAKIVAVIDDNTAILDRSFNEAISVSRLYKSTYSPDYNDDAIFGRVKWNGYDNVDDIHTFTVDTFITVDEGLNVGALDVLVRPDVGSILYSENGTTQETQFTSPLTVTLIASGFSNPQFRVTKVEGAGATLDFDMEEDSLDIPFVGNNGALDYTEDLFTTTEANSIAWQSGEEIKITAEVREANNTGVNTTGEGYILKVSSGAQGIDGKTVELRAEDYSIIYDEAGATPIIGGNSDRVITFTATARNYDDPQFKFTFNGQNLSNTSAFTLGGDPGYDNTTPGATYVWGTAKEVDVEDGIVATATVTVPETYDGNWGDNKNQKTFFVTVEAREGSTGPFTATDEVTIIGVHALKGGYWVAMSNASGNSIPTDFEGEVIGTADANGFVTVVDTGTTIEVGKGATILELTDLNTATWDAAAPSSKLGFYNISHQLVPGSSAIELGEQTGGDEDNDYIVTYADHKFSKTGWTQETAGIQYIIDIEDTGSANAIKITQPFTKSKQGFGGARLVLSNPTEEIASNASQIPDNFNNTGTSVNCFLTGLNLPYYAAGATVPSTVNAFWRLKSIDPTNVTADSSPTYPSNGSTAAVVFGNITAFPKTYKKGSITFTAGLFIRGGDGGFVEEELEVDQTFTKNTSGANVSITATPSHYIYDQDTTTPSPATDHTFSVRGFAGPDIDYKYVITGGALGTGNLSGTVTAGNNVTGLTVDDTDDLPYYDSNGNVNEYIYTVDLYDASDTNNETILATDSVTISLSKSAPDNLILDLTNDYDAVVVPAGSSGSDLDVSVSTTANVYKDGVLEDVDDWNFTASQSTTLRDGSVSTSALTMAFDSTDANKLNITSITEDTYRSAITISASHATNSNYATQNAIFVLQRLFGGRQLQIIPSVDAITYNPNTDSYSPSNGTVTFTVNQITENGEETFTDYYYELDGGSRTDATVTAPSKNFTSGAPDPVVNDSTTLKVFYNNVTNTVADTSTVPLIVSGENGVSLTSTQEYYKLTNSATAPDRYSTGTTIDTGWTTTPPQPTSSNKYLWNFNRNTKSNGTTEDTNVILLSTLVKSIASITEAYQVHNSPTAANTSGTWYSTIAAAVAAQAITSSYPYLWNRTTIAYTDGSTSTVVYSLIAVRGNDGVSFSGTVEYYKIHNSKTNAPARYSSGTTIDSGWNTTPATPTTTNRYTWNFNRSTKSDSTFTDSQPVLVSELLKSISSITEEYQKGSSATTAPTGTWYSTIAAAGSIDATNPYMWNRTTIAYTDGSTSTVTTTVIAARGSDGVSYTGTAEYYKLTNSTTAPGRYSSGTTIDTGWSTSPSTPTSTNQYLWNFNRNSKSDGTFQDSAVYLVTQFVQDGSDGKGISSITEQYARHTSASSAPSSGWSTTFPTISANYPYIWNRTRINYTDGTNSGWIYTLIAARGTDGTTPVKGTDYFDGDDGADAGQVVTGYIYSAAANPTVPSSQTYNFANAGLDSAFTNITGWSTNPPTFNSTNNTIYYAYYKAVETVTNGNATGSGTVTFSARQTGTSFTGLVTFHSAGGPNGDGAFSTDGGSTFTSIDGGKISTGTIAAESLTIGEEDRTSSRLLLLEDSLKIFQGTTLRVHLGNLNNSNT